MKKNMKVYVYIIILLLFAALQPATARETVVGEVIAGEKGYEMDVEVINWKDESITDVSVEATELPGGLTNFIIEPPFIKTLPAGETAVFRVKFDVAENADQQDYAEIAYLITAKNAKFDNPNPRFAVAIIKRPTLQGPDESSSDDYPLINMVLADVRTTLDPTEGTLEEQPSGSFERQKGRYTEWLYSVKLTDYPTSIIMGRPFSIGAEVQYTGKYTGGKTTERGQFRTESVCDTGKPPDKTIFPTGAISLACGLRPIYVQGDAQRKPDCETLKKHKGDIIITSKASMNVYLDAARWDEGIPGKDGFKGSYYYKKTPSGSSEVMVNPKASLRSIHGTQEWKWTVEEDQIAVFEFESAVTPSEKYAIFRKGDVGSNQLKITFGYSRGMGGPPPHPFITLIYKPTTLVDNPLVKLAEYSHPELEGTEKESEEEARIAKADDKISESTIDKADDGSRGPDSEVRSPVTDLGSRGSDREAATNKSKIPNVAGLDLGDAVAAIKKAGLNPIPEVGSETADPNKVNTVARLEPSAGIEIEKGSDVTLIVYSRKETAASSKVPNVVGMGLRDAVTEVKKAGLNPIPEVGSETADPNKVNTVALLKPSVGVEVERGSDVILIVYTRRETVVAANIPQAEDKQAHKNTGTKIKSILKSKKSDTKSVKINNNGKHTYYKLKSVVHDVLPGGAIKPAVVSADSSGGKVVVDMTMANNCTEKQQFTWTFTEDISILEPGSSFNVNGNAATLYKDCTPKREPYMLISGSKGMMLNYNIYKSLKSRGINLCGTCTSGGTNRLYGTLDGQADIGTIKVWERANSPYIWFHVYIASNSYFHGKNFEYSVVYLYEKAKDDSKTKAIVPNVLGKELRDAVTAIKKAGLNPVPVLGNETTDLNKVNKVARLEPAAGVEVEKSSDVILTVYSRVEPKEKEDFGRDSKRGGLGFMKFLKPSDKHERNKRLMEAWAPDGNANRTESEHKRKTTIGPLAAIEFPETIGWVKFDLNRNSKLTRSSRGWKLMRPVKGWDIGKAFELSSEANVHKIFSGPWYAGSSSLQFIRVKVYWAEKNDPGTIDCSREMYRYSSQISSSTDLVLRVTSQRIQAAVEFISPLTHKQWWPGDDTFRSFAQYVFRQLESRTKPALSANQERFRKMDTHSSGTIIVEDPPKHPSWTYDGSIMGFGGD